MASAVDKEEDTTAAGMVDIEASSEPLVARSKVDSLASGSCEEEVCRMVCHRAVFDGTVWASDAHIAYSGSSS